MGYSYGRSESGRLVLACDGCGKLGGVRKRTCPHKVYYAEGGSSPYCPAPALCTPCYHVHKGAMHRECAEGAAKATAREVERKRRLEAGEAELRTCWGSWHETVPAGFVGARYLALGGKETYVLLPDEPKAETRSLWLSEAVGAVPWENHA